MTLSFQRLFFILAFIIGLFAILVFARALLIPLSMALFISFILLPVVKKIEGWAGSKLFSAFLSLLMLVIILGGGITLFSAEIMSLSNQLNDFNEKIMDTLSKILAYINGNVDNMDDLNGDEMVEKGND